MASSGSGIDPAKLDALITNLESIANLMSQQYGSASGVTGGRTVRADIRDAIVNKLTGGLQTQASSKPKLLDETTGALRDLSAYEKDFVDYEKENVKIQKEYKKYLDAENRAKFKASSTLDKTITIVGGLKRCVDELNNAINSIFVTIQKIVDYSRLSDKYKHKQYDFAKRQLDIDTAKSTIDAQIGKLKLERQKQINNYITTEWALQKAIWGLEEAQIKARWADMDLAKGLLELEGERISVHKKLAEVDKQYKKELEQLYEPWAKIDQASAQFVRTIGGSAASMASLRKETIGLVNARSMGSKYNISAEELLKIQTKYNEELGRSTKLTLDQKENLSALRAVVGDDKAVEFVTKLDQFGYDANRATSLANKMFREASKNGVSFSKYSKNFLTNMTMAKNLSFANGVKDMAKMAEQATKLNFNMQETAKAADKMSTFEGAMEASANLSVLGGSYASFSNPLAMMNESLTDPKALQDRIVNMFGDQAQWDSNKGEIGFNPGQLVKLKEAAKSMGLDAGEMENLALSKARRNKLEPEVSALNVSDDLKELIRNTAQLDKNGKGYVTINGQEKSLDQINESDKQALQAQTQTDGENIRDIAVSTRGMLDIMQGYDKAFNDSMAKNIEKTGVGESFKKLTAGQAANSAYMANMTANILKYGKEQADFNKKKTEFDAKYFNFTVNDRKRMLQIQHDRTLLAEKEAELAVENAKIDAQILDYQKSIDKAEFNRNMQLKIWEEQFGLFYQQQVLDWEKSDYEREFLRQRLTGPLDIISSILGNVLGLIGAWNVISNFAKLFKGQAGIGSSISSAGSKMAKGFEKGLRAVGSGIKSASKGLWKGIRGIGSGLLKGVKGIWRGISKVGGWIAKGFSSLKSLIKPIGRVLTRIGGWIAKGFKWIVKKLGGTGAGIISGAFEAYDEFFGDNKDKHTTERKVADVAMHAGGAALGAEAGALIGSFIFPGVGTAIGGILGGIAGELIADFADKKLDEKQVGLTDKGKEEASRYSGGGGKIWASGSSSATFKSIYTKPVNEIPQVREVIGKSHADGGVKARIGGVRGTMEGGESVVNARLINGVVHGDAVINKNATSSYAKELEAINNGTLPHGLSDITNTDIQSIKNIATSSYSNDNSASSVYNGGNVLPEIIVKPTQVCIEKGGFDSLDVNPSHSSYNSDYTLNTNNRVEGIPNSIDINVNVNVKSDGSNTNGLRPEDWTNELNGKIALELRKILASYENQGYDRENSLSKFNMA